MVKCVSKSCVKLVKVWGFDRPSCQAFFVAPAILIINHLLSRI